MKHRFRLAAAATLLLACGGAASAQTIPDYMAPISAKSTASYSCNYAGTRVEYSATEITYPNGTNPVQ